MQFIEGVRVPIKAWTDGVQEEGVTSRLYRSKHSDETKPEVSVLCTTGNCKVGRYEDREMRRMLERTPR